MERASLLNLSRAQKVVLLITIDVLLLVAALWASFSLRFGELFPYDYIRVAIPLFLIAPSIIISFYFLFGQYRTVLRYMQIQSTYTLLGGVVFGVIALYIAVNQLGINPFPRSIPIIFGFIGMLLIGGSRIVLKGYYNWIMERFTLKEPVLIYGAGNSGAQLARILKSNSYLKPVGFIDDDKSIHGITLVGTKVFGLNSLPKIINESKVSRILIAIPSLDKNQIAHIVDSLSRYPIRVQSVPSLGDILSGNTLDKLRDIDLEDLLGRASVPPDPYLLTGSIYDCSVMITGAGGSIGSELCRQVILSKPQRLVLFENSEYALYKIEQEISELIKSSDLDVDLVCVLGNILDKNCVAHTLEKYSVDTLYHAAAYKHVPIVEENILQGIENNVLGTAIVAEAAIVNKVSRFILISTDKAVRPTNVMGATKRFAELLIQAHAQNESNTIFSIVRFGNVLGSSGSVVPLFKSQILNGGPVTVTHPDITRFFMTIPEAAQLVIQAGTLAKGGEVFVLDMGEPVKIYELAKQMIHLMGYKLKSEVVEDSEKGIDVVFTNLRSGEKLYEELLIGEDTSRTRHPKILCAQEEMLSSDQVNYLVQSISMAVQSSDVEAGLKYLREAVPDYKPLNQDGILNACTE